MICSPIEVIQVYLCDDDSKLCSPFCMLQIDLRGSYVGGIMFSLLRGKVLFRL